MARARHAQTLAEAHGADVALWFVIDSTQLRIYAHKANGEPQLVRSIQGTGSGTRETAALITRSTLLALSKTTDTPAAVSGTPTRTTAGQRDDAPHERRGDDAAAATPRGGDERAASVGPSEGATAMPRGGGERAEHALAAPSGESAVATLRVGGRRDERAASGRFDDGVATAGASAAEGGDSGHGAEERARVSVLAGWQGVVDGSGGAGQHGFAVRGTMSFGLLELGLGLSASVPVTRRDALAELAIARHAALASVGLAAASGALRLSGGIHAGVALFQRSTTARTQELAPEGASFTPAGVLGPWLGIAYMPGKLGVGLQLGLDILPGPPSFVYRYSDDEQLAHRPWALQPRAAIGIQGELR